MEKLTFLGDVFIDQKCVSEVDDIGRYILNLESVISDRPPISGDRYNLKVTKNHLIDTFGVSPELVCLANNHVLDCGQEGFEDTLESLRDIGVPFYGAGFKEDGCNNPAYLSCGGKKVAVLGFVCETTSPKFARRDEAGVSPIEVISIGESITQARKNGADRIVVSLHWGAEDVKLPKPNDICIAHQLIDVGADLIIGHHTHCTQPWERYNGRYIFYGLGNCIFPDKVISTPGKKTSSGRLRRYGRPGRKSWAVDYYPDDNNVRVRELYFTGKKLFARSVIDHEIRMLFSNPKVYEKRFRRSYFIGKTRSAFRNYFWSPKMPRIEHFRVLAKFAFPRKYE